MGERQRLRPGYVVDVILMDLFMPVMDGISAITAIRDHRIDQRAGTIGYLLKDTKMVFIAR